MMKKLGLIAVVGLVVTPAMGGLVAPTSYAMPNGNGFASGGSVNYWDRAYTGTGSTTTDNAPLSGGLGDLTDGFVSTQNWNEVVNAEGTGPYVGWNSVDPSIVFSFAAPFTPTTVRVHVDDSNGYGGVFIPSLIKVTIGAESFSLIPQDDITSEPKWFDIAIPANTPAASEFTVEINRKSPGLWVFADEIQFVAIPEPTALALLIPGLALLTTRPRR